MNVFSQRGCVNRVPAKGEGRLGSPPFFADRLVFRISSEGLQSSGDYFPDACFGNVSASNAPITGASFRLAFFHSIPLKSM